MSADTIATLGLVGALTQLGSILLILLLMLLLAAEQRDARHFRRWTQAWLAFAIAIAAIALRHSNVTGRLDLWQRDDGDLAVRLLYATYAGGKFWFLSSLVIGVHLWRAPQARVPSTMRAAIASLALGVLTVLLVTPLNGIMIVQSAVAVPAFAWCTFLLLSGDRHRRSTGELLLAVALGAHAILWTAYGLAFGLTAFGLFGEWLGWIPRFNSYVDATLQTLLAYAMVTLLMERATHESRAAHAKLQEAHAALRRAAMYDPLSGVLNRQAFSEGLGLDAAMKVTGIVAIIDVDHLKPVNDSLGHVAGDSLLRHLAQTVSNMLRVDDAFYRWGGDEFLLILPGADEFSARCILDRALSAASSLSFAGILLSIRVSYGCAPYTDRESLDAAIQAADRAMYEAKSARHMVRAVSPTGVVAVGYSGDSELVFGAL